MYRIWPFWHAAKKIIRLRFDPPNAGEFEIQWIRIAEKTERWPPRLQTAWQRQRDWRTVACFGRRGRGFPRADSAEPAAGDPRCGPPFVCVRMATDRAGSGRLFCVSSSAVRLGEHDVSSAPDGKTAFLQHRREWSEQVARRDHHARPPGADCRRRQHDRSNRSKWRPNPAGPPSWRSAYFGPSEGIQRAGRPARVSCMTAEPRRTSRRTNVTATLQVRGRRQDARRRREENRSAFARTCPRPCEWQVRSETLGKIESGGAR